MTNIKTMTKTMTNTFREHLQRAIFETFELWDIWSEWWGNMTWPTKRQQRRQTQWQWQKFRVWPLIHCYESDSSRPNWWGLTKFHNFRQISQFWPISQFQPNFTILEYLKYLEYLELGQFRNLAMFLILNESSGDFQQAQCLHCEKVVRQGKPGCTARETTYSGISSHMRTKHSEIALQVNLSKK